MTEREKITIRTLFLVFLVIAAVYGVFVLSQLAIRVIFNAI